MELILIACCGTKNVGGTEVYTPPSIRENLIDTSFQNLLSARLQIGKMKGELPDEDLGHESAQKTILYMPAYQRYAGHMYTRSDFRNLYPLAKNKTVLIISALYGMIDAGDSIRCYNAAMNEILSNRVKLFQMWDQFKLGDIVEEYIRAVQPTQIHDLLSGVYRKALMPWPRDFSSKSGIKYKPYNFPGEGNGADWHRGDRLKELLRRN